MAASTTNSLRSAQYWFNLQHWVVYFVLSWGYGSKISRMLKGGAKGAESVELKKIRKYAR